MQKIDLHWLFTKLVHTDFTNLRFASWVISQALPAIHAHTGNGMDVMKSRGPWVFQGGNRL